jgi:hypothetical protein
VLVHIRGIVVLLGLQKENPLLIAIIIITWFRMEGPFQLDENVIDAVITQTTPAVYLIRRIEETEAYAHYKARIERADDGTLKEKLKQWIGSDYRVFCFQYVKGIDTAFQRQCILWHEMGGAANELDNERHPVPNEGCTVLCSICANATDRSAST